MNEEYLDLIEWYVIGDPDDLSFKWMIEAERRARLAFPQELNPYARVMYRDRNLSHPLIGEHTAHPSC